MKIMVIDDDKNVRRLLRDSLKNERYEVIEGADGEDGIAKLVDNPDVDLVLLDVRMPKMSGFEVIGEIREITDAPVIFLTALDESYDEIKGLELGADDYITKPFSYEVLTARVRSCLRKNRRFSSDIVKIGNLEMDSTNKTALIQGKNVELTLKEFELLELFVRYKNITMDRNRLLDRIWGYDYEGDPRTVDTHVKTLRAKLGSSSEYIKTIRGTGYRFEETK